MSITSKSFLALLAALSMGLSGCGGEPNGPPEKSPENVIRATINSVPDRATLPAEFGSLFVDGQPPQGTSPQDYVPLRCEAKSLQIGSGQATAQVAVTAENQTTDHDGAPTVEWVLVQEGEKWKLKSAPLP